MTKPNSIPPGVDPLELRLTLLTEMWLLSATLAFRHDTAPQLFLFNGIREMSRDLRASGLDDPANILDDWVERLDDMARTHDQVLRSLTGE